MALVLNGNGTVTGLSDISTDLVSTGDISAVDATLSGGVYVGGTGSANYLDDYEEGTWTPSFNGFSITGTVNVTGTYTKVGNLVYINAYIDARSGTIAATAGSSYLSGLPFSSSGASSGTWVNRETIADDGGFMVFSTNVYITNGWSAVAHRFFLSTVYYTTA